MPPVNVLLVGAGLANASLLYFLRKQHSFQGSKYTVIDQRAHVGGNCYTCRDSETEITVHRYGPHIFNTNSSLAWDFMCTHLSMHFFVNRVKACTASGIYSFPINLHTINQHFGLKLNPAQAKAFMEQKRSQYYTESPRNFEEAMLSHIGMELYSEFIYGYTSKQWGVEPSTLPASIARRLPFRLSYDDNYYDKRYQGIPVEGYTKLFEEIFLQEDVSLRLESNYDHSMASDFDLIIYTGSIDEYFGFDLGRLSYRTVHWERHVNAGSFQGNAVINYTDINVAHTRINEPLYFEPWRTDTPEHSVYFVEFSKATEPDDIPYYPIRLDRDKQLLTRYQSRAAHAAKSTGTRILFHGRLGTYQYLDMDRIIDQSASLADQLNRDYD